MDKLFELFTNMSLILCSLSVVYLGIRMLLSMEDPPIEDVIAISFVIASSGAVTIINILWLLDWIGY